MRKILTILSLLILTTNHFGYATPKNHLKNKTPQIPVLFNDLSRFKQVDYRKFIISTPQGVGRPLTAINHWYYFKTINSVQISCTLGDDMDATHSGGCWFGSRQATGSASVSNSLSSPNLISLNSQTEASFLFVPQVPVTPSGIIFPTLHVGEKFIIPKVPSNRMADATRNRKYNSTLTCVVPDQDSVGCIYSTKHGFLTNKEGITTF